MNYPTYDSLTLITDAAQESIDLNREALHDIPDESDRETTEIHINRTQEALRELHICMIDSYLRKLVTDYIEGMTEAEDDNTILQTSLQARVADFCTYLRITELDDSALFEGTPDEPAFMTIRTALERAGVQFPVIDYEVQPVKHLHRSSFRVRIKQTVTSKWRTYIIQFKKIKATPFEQS